MSGYAHRVIFAIRCNRAAFGAELAVRRRSWREVAQGGDATLMVPVPVAAGGKVLNDAAGGRVLGVV
jgi:hypothetical protein